MSQSFRVLIVEDHDSLRQSLSELVQARGFEPLLAERGDRALDLARTAHPDFGILDMHLPGGTGLELFQKIATELGTLPSIMMSGEATSTETQAALAAGIFSFLKKPIEIDQLQRTLDRLIAHHFPPRKPLG